MAGSAYPSEATVVLTKYQQWGVVDANDMATIPQATTDNLVAAFLAAGQGYTGLGVTVNPDALGVTVGTGILYNLGGGYPLRSAEPIDLTPQINAIPDTVSSQIVLIVANGGTSQITESRTLEDASLKPTNPADLWPTTQQVITTRAVRVLTPSIVPGVSAATNVQSPAYNPLLCLLATVTINKTGVVSVVQATGAQITRLDQLAPVVAALSSRADADESLISGLQSTVSGLAITLMSRLAADEANLTALGQRLAALESRTVTSSTGSVLTIIDNYTDGSGLTPGDGTGYGVGTGLTFPQSTKNPTTYFPINAYGSNLALLGGRYLTAPYTEKAVLGTLNNTGGSRVNMAAETPWNAALKSEGFGVARTRYGASYPAQASTQLMASGDPTRLFAINPGDLVYDASWADWRIRNPELNHQNGYWHDVTSREPWTPRTADGTAGNVQAISQPVNKPYPEMETSWLLANGNIPNLGTGVRLLICEDLNGSPDPSAVLMDVPGTYSKTYAGIQFIYPYPWLRKANKLYHRVVLSAASQVYLSTSKNAGTPLLHLNPNGSWSPDPNGYSLNAGYTVAQFAQGTPIELNLLYLGGGIDNIDLLAPAIVPDGCDILYGTIPSGSPNYTRFGPIDPANPASNLLAGRPSQLRPFVELIVTAATAPVIDLQASATGNVGAVSARRGTTLTAESAVRAPKDQNGNPLAVTKITRSVTLVGFNPALHTYTEQLETGAGYTTLTAPTATGTPTVQPDGTTLMTFSWTVAAVTTFKVKQSGTTSDAAQSFRLSQSITTAAP